MVAYPAPRRLGAPGRELWRRLTKANAAGELLLSSGELTLLELAARQADDVARLEALIDSDGITVTGSKGQVRLSTAVAEVRLQRAALARLIGQLALPDEGEAVGQSSTSRKAQRAADARWARQAEARESRRSG